MAGSYRHRGFSLVEILITLSIMGVVAVFAIPKVLDSGNNSTSSSAKQTTMAREVAFVILNAYEQYKAANGTVPSTLKASDLTPYMNYVSVLPTNTQLDIHANALGVSSCTGGIANTQDGVCLRLHNGGAIWAGTAIQFGGTTPLNNVFFRFDPNAIYDGASSDAPGTGIQMSLYYDGAIRTRGTMRSNSSFFRLDTNSNAINQPVPVYNPSWFTGF